MNLVLIVNPAASSVTPRARLVIERALKSGHNTTVLETEGRDHATELARQAVQDKVDVVVVLSGDGTVNEVANALAGTDTALAALPGGSTNVFCRSVNMTNDPIEATGILLHLLANDKPRSIGLGSAGGRYFLMNVGVGFDAAVVERVERKSWIKRYASHQYFTLAALFQWGRIAAKQDMNFNVHFGDDFILGDSKLVGVPHSQSERHGFRDRTSETKPDVQSFLTICLNANPYTYVGALPFDVAPEANFQRGLTAVSIHHQALPTVLGVLLTALKSGRRITRSPRVDYRENVTNIQISSDRKFPYQMDGEFIAEVNELELKHHSNALKAYVALDDTELA